MKTHENRALFSRALLKATTCLFLTAGIGISAAYAVPEASTSVMETVQQNQTISGRITDTSGEPVIGASVVVKGTTNGTITDFDGKFSLNAPAQGTLTISYIGYKKMEISINGQRTVNVTLKEDTEILDEVVVVGYGTQKKATLTGSVSSVSGEDIKKVSAANLSNTLAGKTAGIIANTRSGEPGEDGADILIRGKGTLGNTSPLIVVDGIADRSFSRLNPEDIESISVLKDASAAIYGARAANGVILVTTKRGKEGKMQVNYNGSYTLSQPTRIPQMLNSYQYATYVNEYDADPRHDQGGITYSDEVLQHYINHDDDLNYPDTDWWDAVAKDWAGKTQHSLSVSGGNDKLSFYSSAQYMWQDAIYKQSTQDYKQYQFITNIDAKINKSVRFSFDILGRQEQRNRGIYSTPYLFTYFLTTFPGSAPYFPNGLPRVGYDGITRNAAIMVTDQPGYNKYTYNILNLKPLLHIDLDMITKGLYVEGYAALDFHFDNGKSLNQPYDLYYYDKATNEYQNKRADTGKISVNSWSSNYKTITLNARIGYSHTFAEAHKVDAFVAYEQSKYDYNTLSAYRTNYLSTAIPEIFAGSSVPKDKDNGGYSDATARCNFFGRINYGYKDKYLAEVTLRYDGSMNFAPGHRWGLFPAFSLGWVMSEEKFFEPIKDVVSFFKLKGSWGMMGNDNIAAYQFMSQYKFLADNKGPYFGAGEDGHINQGFYQARVANPVVTWEKAKTLNLGLSTQFLNGKFGLDFDWFHSNRNDILCYRNASIPYYAGMTLPQENIGEVTNSGIEIIATYRDRAGDFEWGITGNLTYAKNKVNYMDEAASTPAWQKTEGHPIDGQVLYKALGIYQTQEQVDNTPHIDGAKPGDLIYQDTNGDGNITWDDAIRIDETATPKIIYGFTLNGGWKGIDLNMFFQGQAKASQLVQPTMNMATDFYEGRWKEGNTSEENANARWPKAFIKQTYGDTWNGQASTWWLRNASFLRLKSVELGYTLPKDLTAKVGIQKARIYVNGANLFTIDNYKIADPEAGVTRNDNNEVINSNGVLSYPLQRTITFGANITF